MIDMKHRNIFRSSELLALVCSMSSPLLLNGCKSAEPTTQPDKIADSIGVENVRREWAEAAEKGAVPDGWMKTFNDPTMEELVVEALRHNMALRGARTRIDA